MNILSLKLFKLLKKRPGKLAAMLAAKNEAAKLAELSWAEAQPKAAQYTLVDNALGGRKIDMAIHLGNDLFEKARYWHKAGKSRWLHNTNEQFYKPKVVRLDPQLEFMYEELGFSQGLENTPIGPAKTQHH